MRLIFFSLGLVILFGSSPARGQLPTDAPKDIILPEDNDDDDDTKEDSKDNSRPPGYLLNNNVPGTAPPAAKPAKSASAKSVKYRKHVLEIFGANASTENSGTEGSGVSMALSYTYHPARMFGLGFSFRTSSSAGYSPDWDMEYQQYGVHARWNMFGRNVFNVWAQFGMGIYRLSYSSEDYWGDAYYMNNNNELYNEILGGISLTIGVIEVSAALGVINSMTGDIDFSTYLLQFGLGLAL